MEYEEEDFQDDKDDKNDILKEESMDDEIRRNAGAEMDNTDVRHVFETLKNGVVT